MNNRLMRFGNRKLLVAAVLMLGVVVLAGIVYWQMTSNRDDPPALQANSNACSTDHVQRYNEAAEPLSISSLTALATEIKSIDGHDSNANCLYILTRQQLAIGDPDAAEQSLERLRTISSDGVQLSSQFTPAPVRYEVLESSVENLRFDQDQNEPNPLWEGSE